METSDPTPRQTTYIRFLSWCGRHLAISIPLVLLAFGGVILTLNALANRAPPMPSDEEKFCRVISTSRDAYRTESAGGRNEIRLTALRTKRDEALDYQARQISGWVATVKHVETGVGGDAMLSVVLPCDATLSTSNTTLTAILSKTLIEKSSPLYARLGEVSEGDQVHISGQFFSADKGLAEKSVTESGSMTEPEFAFRFEDLSRN